MKDKLLKYGLFVVVILFSFACHKTDQERKQMKMTKEKYILIMTQNDLYLEPIINGPKIGVCDAESILLELDEIVVWNKMEGRNNIFERVVCNGKEGYINTSHVIGEWFFGSKEELLKNIDKYRAYHLFRKNIVDTKTIMKTNVYEHKKTRILFLSEFDVELNQIGFGIENSYGIAVLENYTLFMIDSNTFQLTSKNSQIIMKTKNEENIFIEVIQTNNPKIKDLNGKEFVPSYQSILEICFDPCE